MRPIKEQLIWFVLGFIIIESVRLVVGIDKLANEIQVLSAVPWIYVLYRIEHLHRKHDKVHKNK
jgi:hypothetical protein